MNCRLRLFTILETNSLLEIDTNSGFTFLTSLDIMVFEEYYRKGLVVDAEPGNGPYHDINMTPFFGIISIYDHHSVLWEYREELST